MNRTLKEAAVQRYYDTHGQLRRHLADYNFAKRLKC
jgi:TnpA family transposase